MKRVEQPGAMLRKARHGSIAGQGLGKDGEERGRLL